MHAGNAFDVFQLLHQFHADFHPFALWLPRAAQAFDDRIRDVHPGHIVAYPTRRARRCQRTHPGEDEHPAVQIALAHPLHISGEHRQVKAVLGLHEVGAGRGFFRQPLDPKIERLDERVGGRAEEDARRLAERAPA